MKLLISHCNTERVELFGLSFHDLESQTAFWVDLRGAELDPQVDVGFTGLCRGPDAIYVGVQSVHGGKILVLDEELTYRETLRLQLAEDIHSLDLVENCLYVTSTRSNTLVCFDLESREETVFWQNPRYIHLNDVKFHRGDCYVLSQDSPGEGKNTGGTVTRLKDGTTIVTGLDQPHSMWFEGDRLLVLSSRKGDVKRVDLNTLECTQVAHLDGYVRGLWCDGKQMYVATSAERIHSRKQGPAVSFVDDMDAYMDGQQCESTLYTMEFDGRLLAANPLSTLNFEVYDLLALSRQPAAGRLLDRPEIFKAHFLRHQRANEQLESAKRETTAPASSKVLAPPLLPPPDLALYLDHRRRFRSYDDSRDSFVRGAWYFSDGWPVNFWSHIEAGKAHRELAQIKSMGFNTVFILIPWRGFQPDVASAKCCRKHRKRARVLLRTCEKLDLRVCARVSYGHSMCPDSKLDGQERVEQLLSDERVLKNWLSYLSVLDTLKKYRSLSMFFLCWEDFWHSFSAFQRRDPDQRKQLAARIGYQRYVDEQGLELYNKAGFSSEPMYSDVADVEIPLSDSGRQEIYLRFINVRLRELFVRARDHISPLTMEIRVDKDLVRRSDGSTAWIDHDSFTDLDLPTMSYWAPFVGSENRGETLTKQQALDRLDFQLVHLPREHHTPPPLINQFNFVDTTPEFAGVHATIDSGQVVAFLDEVSTILLARSSGYALWALRNYYQNLLYNGSFALSGEGWDVTPARGCRFHRMSGETVVKMANNATLSQSLVPVERGMAWIHKADKLFIRLDFPDSSAGEEKRLRVGLAGHASAEVNTTDISATRKIEFSGTHKAEEMLTLDLQNLGEKCVVQRICLYNYEFESHILDARARPTEYAEAVESLNRDIRDNRRREYAGRVFLRSP